MEQVVIIRRTQNQVVILCPYCKCEHFHWEVGIQGHRMAHCGLGEGYDIVDDLAKKSQGFMYLAKRPCRKVSAMAWDDSERGVNMPETVGKYLARGDKVERVEVFEGDPPPEMICHSGCEDCMTPNGRDNAAQRSEARR